MEKGDSIVVLEWRDSYALVRTTICGFEMWSAHRYLVYTRDNKPPGVVRESREGITWARGHSGPAVDALLVVGALR